MFAQPLYKYGSKQSVQNWGHDSMIPLSLCRVYVIDNMVNEFAGKSAATSHFTSKYNGFLGSNSKCNRSPKLISLVKGLNSEYVPPPWVCENLYSYSK